MLRQLRNRKVMKRVMQALLILVIPSFVFFYGWSSLTDTPGGVMGDYFARFKEPGALPWPLGRWQNIGRSEMSDAKTSLQREYLAFLGQNYQGDLEQLVSTKDIVLEAIDRDALDRFAGKNGIAVSSDELKQYLAHLFAPNPQTNYDAYLRSRGISSNYFEAQTHHDLLLSRVRSDYLSSAKVSLYELWKEYLIAKEQVKISYVKFQTDDYVAKVQVDEKKLENFFESNVENYRVPDQVDYEYVAITREELDKQIHVGEEDAQKYFDEHKQEYVVPKRVRVRHILLKVAEGATEEQAGAIDQKSIKLYGEAKKGEDFAKLADESSEDEANVDPNDPTKKNGGLVGWVSQALAFRFGDEIVAEALKLEKGQISKPFRTSKGFEILKAEEVEEETQQPFAVVQSRVMAELRAKKSDELFAKAGDEWRELVTKYTTLDSFAKAADRPTTRTGFIDRKNSLFGPRVGSFSRNQDYLMSLLPGVMADEVITNYQSHAVVQVAEERPSHIPELAEVREPVEKDFRRKEAVTLAREAVKEFKDSIHSRDEMTTRARELGLEARTTDYFTRLEPPPDLGNLSQFAQTTLRIKKDEIAVATIGSSPDSPTGFLVWRLDDNRAPSLDEFRNEMFEYSNDLLYAKRRAALEEWFLDQRSKYKIQFNPAIIKT
ncbi:MAG: peptidyl-prolyl cis-trans isomerase, partial [bacterium]